MTKQPKKRRGRPRGALNSAGGAWRNRLCATIAWRLMEAHAVSATVAISAASRVLRKQTRARPVQENWEKLNEEAVRGAIKRIRGGKTRPVQPSPGLMLYAQRELPMRLEPRKRAQAQIKLMEMSNAEILEKARSKGLLPRKPK